jgi:hypothetical protein
VHVDDALGGGTYGFHDQGPDGDVWNESAIHDVHVDPIRARSINRLDFGAKAAKISGKNGRGDPDGLRRARHGSSQAPQGRRVNGIRSLTAIVLAKDNGMAPQGAYERE